MDRDQIIETLKSLARSQGSYGRLLDSITEEGIQFLADMRFADPVDLVMYLEG